jgi:hypothetical protein
MEDICQHIMDLAENSVAAGAGRVEIRVVEDEPGDRLLIEMIDDGSGICAEAQAELNGPLEECKVCGMGITLFSRACQDAGGRIRVESSPSGGTAVRGEMRLSHEDCGEVGDLGETLITLIMASPGVDWSLTHEVARDNGQRGAVKLDTRDFRAEIGGAPLAHPEVIRRMRASLRAQQSNLP